MKKILLFLFLCISYTLGAQPSPRKVVAKNINDYTPSEITEDNYRNINYYIIDSSSDVSKINNLRSLTSIHIIVKVKTLPVEISVLQQSLLYIDVDAVNKLTDISSINKLTNLKSITLKDFKGVQLPDLSQLSTLNSVYLQGAYLEDISALVNCKALSDVTIISGSLSSFPIFDNNNKIKQLSLTMNGKSADVSGVAALQNLQVLSLDNAGLKTFPPTFGKNLERISLVNCLQLQDITDLNKYSKLKDLVIANSGLRIFQTDLSNSQIESLSISGNHCLKNIAGIATIPLLKALVLTGMDSLEKLDFDMSRMNLAELRIESLPSLKDISGISSCRSLKKISLYKLPSIKKMDFDMSSSNIEEMNIGELENLDNINGVSKCKNLKSLVLYGINIRKLPRHMSDMESLESFTIFSTKISDISNLKEMKNLKKVEISSAPQLESIPKTFNTNLKIESVKLFLNKKLRYAEGLTQLKNLKDINVMGLDDEFKLPEKLNTCTNLESITLVSNNVNDFSMINDLENLKKLTFYGPVFSEIPNELFTNKNLQDINIQDDSLIRDLNCILNFKNLRRLDIEDNDELTTIPDLYNKIQLIARRNKNLKIPASYKGRDFGYMIEGNGGYEDDN